MADEEQPEGFGSLAASFDAETADRHKPDHAAAQNAQKTDSTAAEAAPGHQEQAEDGAGGAAAPEGDAAAQESENGRIDGATNAENEEESADNAAAAGAFASPAGGSNKRKIADLKRARSKGGSAEGEEEPASPTSPTSPFSGDFYAIVEKKWRRAVREAFGEQNATAIFKAVYVGARPTKLYAENESRSPAEIVKETAVAVLRNSKGKEKLKLKVWAGRGLKNKE